MSVHDSHDFWRHTPCRYLGYANEVGEAFRYQISKKILISAYLLSGSYVLGDTIDKAYKSYKKKKETSEPCYKTLAKSTALTLVWQLLATEIIPGLFVYLVVKEAKKYKYLFIKSARVRFWMPTLIGLFWIPCFPYSIDPMVDKAFDYFNLDLDLH